MRPPSPIAALVFTLAVAYCQNDADLIQKYQQQIQANRSNSRAHYELAEIYFQQHNYQTAANEYRMALNGDLEPRLIETLSHLGLAKIFDLSGQPDRAANERAQAARSSESQTLRVSTPQPAPFPISRTGPEYSEEARAAGLEGIIFVTTNILPDGTPDSVRIQSPLGLGLDEKAIEAVKAWRFPPRLLTRTATVAVNFLLPTKLSRWHLVSASFQIPEGSTRPTFLTEPYPLGPGVSNKAIDEGWVISAIPRSATVRLQFTVSERGVPTKFQVLDASADVWGDEAIAVVRRWRFAPGSKEGQPVSVPCIIDLVWGQKVWPPETLAKIYDWMHRTPEPPQPSASGTPPTVTSISLLEGDTPQNPYSVVVSLIIGADGVPTNLRVLRSLGAEFDSQALEAARQWRFKPATLNGSPAALPANIELDFAGTQ